MSQGHESISTLRLRVAVSGPIPQFQLCKVDPMSSTTFEPVFRVGASGHPVETLDTGAEGAGGAQQPRSGLLCPARAEKKLGSPTVLTDNTDRPGDDSRAPGAAARCYRRENSGPAPGAP